jgi:hypothetical protein
MEIRLLGRKYKTFYEEEYANVTYFIVQCVSSLLLLFPVSNQLFMKMYTFTHNQDVSISLNKFTTHNSDHFYIYRE